MLNTSQLLHGFAALLGQMIGRMPGPEFFIPVLIAFYLSSKPSHIFFFAIPCALVGSLVWLATGFSPDHVVGDFIVRYLGSVLVIAILFGKKLYSTVAAQDLVTLGH